MCGITGLIDPSGASIDQDALRAMTRTLAPRGPDAEGLWTGPGVGLGHRRLAVIDLSEAGNQPMANEDGSIRVVFNGEIYNFKSLRERLEREGHRFRSHSDTEVIVHGYETWGDEVVLQLDGMFAFALWDSSRRRLLAARDRMGKKPFYFARIPRDGARPPLFAFGSELKAIVHAPGFERTLSLAGLARYLAYEYVPPPYTIFEGARKLDAAERLILDVGDDPHRAPRIDRYWSLPFPEFHANLGVEEAAEELRLLLGRAVARRLVADVPIGVLLSGGLDSSSVAAIVASMAGAERVKTFSIGFWDPSFDESAHAAKVARHLGTDHRQAKLGPGDLLQALPEVTRFLDEPLGDASILPTYLLSRFTRQHVTVALGGDGGDELFAGYPTFKVDGLARLYQRLPASLKRTVVWGAERLRARTEYFSFDFKVHQFLRGGEEDGPRRHQRWLASFLPEEQRALFQPELLAALPADPLSDVDRVSAESRAHHPMDQAMNFYCRFYLSGDYNVKVDRASSAVGLEVRAPFLDTALVEFACRLPPRLRLRGWTSKFVLKRAMRGALPGAIVDRKKQGFGVPVARWIKEDLRGEIQEALSPNRLRSEGLFQPAFVDRLLVDHLSGRRDRRKALWTLYVFQRWLAEWGRARTG